MERTGLLFNGVLYAVLFGSLVFFYSDWIIGWEYFSRAGLAIVILSGFFIDRKRKVIDNKFLTLCLGMVLIRSIREYWYFNIYSVLHLFIGVLAMKLISEKMTYQKELVGKLFASFLVLQILVSIMQVVGMDGYYQPYFNNEIAGTLGRPWILGCAVVMSIPFIANYKPKLLLLAIPLLYLSRSSSCVLAAIVSCVCLIKNKRTSYTLLISGFIFSVAYTLFGEGIDPHRLQVWKNTFAYQEFWGVGLGGWLNKAFAHQNGNDWYPWFWAHNEFYQWLFELGYVGFTFLLGFVITLLMSANTAFKRAILIPLLLICFFHPVFHFGNLAVLAIFSLSFIYVGKGELWQ